MISDALDRMCTIASAGPTEGVSRTTPRLLEMGDRALDMATPVQAYSAAVAASVRVRAAKADDHASQLAPIVIGLRRAGATLAEIAAELGRRRVTAPRGGFRWSKTQVSRVLARAASQRAGR